MLLGNDDVSSTNSPMRTPDRVPDEKKRAQTSVRAEDHAVGARVATEQVRKTRVREAVDRVTRNHADAIARLADR